MRYFEKKTTGIFCVEKYFAAHGTNFVCTTILTDAMVKLHAGPQ